MAQSLVTQVHNPDDPDSGSVELNNNNIVLDEEDKEPEKSSPGFFASCFGCLCCKSNAGDEEVVDNAGNGPQNGALLPKLLSEDEGKKTLVLDLDETLVHSSFKPVAEADFVIAIELENEIHNVYVLKRPGVDEFLETVAQKFEVVIFTASLSKYADPLLDKLDPKGLVRARLFREACVQHYGNYVKDLSVLGRELKDTIIIDNSPYSYIFQPDNAIPISSWFNDPHDRQLWEIMPLLDSMVGVDNVVKVLQSRNDEQNAYDQ